MVNICNEVLLRKKGVLEILNIGSSTFYAMIKAGVLPKGVPIGPRLKGWPASEIQEYIKGQIKARDTGKTGENVTAVVSLERV